MTLHLGHVTDGTSQPKAMDFLAENKSFERMLEIRKLRQFQRLFGTKNRAFDLDIDIFYLFYFYCVAYETSVKARSHDPILGSENWKQVFRRSDFKVPFLW